MRLYASKKALNDYKVILFMIAVMWVLEIANMVFDHRLNYLALVPRQMDSLFGILGMHFLHWSIPHLISNSIPMAILGFLVCINGKGLQVTVSIMLLTGVLVWLFARNGVHAGASGLVLGYWGYLISCAFFERSLRNIVLAIFTIFIYGGIVLSLVDFRESVSFEGHLFGFLAGVVTAWLWRRKGKN